jgi:ketosteroid isomerase-like protein
MNTREVVRQYFDALGRKQGWQSWLADEFTFTSFASPVKKVAGKEPYLQSTQRFFSMVDGVEVRELIIDGASACALTHYRLQTSDGRRFESDVAEILTIRRDRIDSLSIYFDTSPFPK